MITKEQQMTCIFSLFFFIISVKLFTFSSVFNISLVVIFLKFFQKILRFSIHSTPPRSFYPSGSHQNTSPTSSPGAVSSTSAKMPRKKGRYSVGTYSSRRKKRHNIEPANLAAQGPGFKDPPTSTSTPMVRTLY